ncbi:MAG TPA: 1-deoxy-D-xylulose-5-phosphate reductoisomerase [Candidatus Eremiobacteraceae bacterium]|nr:1-deoxy-D-xylulose-5-phosphate reductoisomerase [Candidatus Eremiobacteraceae bacterium]
MRRVAILGSTGSIGRQALDVIARHPERFAIAALAANRSADMLAEQAAAFGAALVSCGDDATAQRCREALETNLTRHLAPRVVAGDDGLRAAAVDSGADIVLAACDGVGARDAVFAAVDAGTAVALANKELAVAYGEALFARARASSSSILPVDSEHSAVFQCLIGEDRSDVRSVVLTASGGPFWELSESELRAVTPEQALRHPTWSMGRKNTIDSATFMNKGLEVIEASRFFSLRAEQIDVVVHRQSVAHAFVTFVDGSVKSQLCAPDMRVPIGFALSYPERLRDAVGEGPTRESIGLGASRSALTFESVDNARFPCLRLAYQALERGGTYPAVLSSANEEAGRAFLEGRTRFTDIARLVREALEAHSGEPAGIPEIARADEWARSYVRDAISSKV